MRHRRLESQNAVREYGKFMIKNCGEDLIKHISRVMKHIAETPKRGLFLKPREIWDGEIDYEFVIE